jgi:hypothetical protein
MNLLTFRVLTQLRGLDFITMPDNGISYRSGKVCLSYDEGLARISWKNIPICILQKFVRKRYKNLYT